MSEISPASLLLFYSIATVFNLYHGGDLMHEMRRRKSELPLLPTQRLFNDRHHISIIREELVFDGAVNYAQWVNGLQHS